MRLRKRAFGLLVGAGILFLIGTSVQAGWLDVLAALLLGALVSGLALPLAALRGLSVELDVSEEAEQGMPTIVELRVSGAARGVRRNVTVRDAHLESVEALVPPIGRHERIDVTTLRTPRRRGAVERALRRGRTARPSEDRRANVGAAARVPARKSGVRRTDRDERPSRARGSPPRPGTGLPRDP